MKIHKTVEFFAVDLARAVFFDQRIAAGPVFSVPGHRVARREMPIRPLFYGPIGAPL